MLADAAWEPTPTSDLFFDLGGHTLPDLHAAAVRRAWTFLRWHGHVDTLRAVLGRLPRDADLGPHGTPLANRAQLLHWERHADSLLQLVTNAPLFAFDALGYYLPPALYVAWAHDLLGDRPAARVAFEAAVGVLDSVMETLPDDWRVHAARGLALAGLGHRDGALREARWLQRSEAYRHDVFGRSSYLAPYRAQILAQAGETGGALDEIEWLVANPSSLSVHTLRLDPLWDPIREHPRFQALLASDRGR